MKKQFAGLSKAEREKVESEYHSLEPKELNKLMSQAKTHTAKAISGAGAQSRAKRKNKTTEKRRAA